MMKYVQCLANEIREQEAAARGMRLPETLEETKSAAIYAVTDILHVCASRGLDPRTISNLARKAFEDEMMIEADSVSGRRIN